MSKSDPSDIGYPEESLQIGSTPAGNPSIFKKSAESYAEYFLIFDRSSDTKEAVAAKKAFSYMAMGERGLLARGPEAVRVIPYILKNTTHPWVKESMATIAGILMQEFDFKSFYIGLLNSAQSEEETLDIMGVAACFKRKKRDLMISWILDSRIGDHLKSRVHEIV
jgi:hypothetical protein